MKLKKVSAALTAVACCAGILCYYPAVENNAFAQEIVSNDFEVNYDGWYGNSDTVRLTAENRAGFNDTRGMIVSGRNAVTDGVCSSKGFYLVGGVKYNYGVKVYSETDEVFHLTLLCIDSETGKEKTVELASKNVKAGEWTEISAYYKAPEKSYEFKLSLYTETTNDFSFDDVKITSKTNSDTVYAATAEKGLKDEFASYFRVGNILNGGTVKNSAITANIIKDFNSIECENEFKPDATLVQSQCSGTNIAVSLNNAASIMDFCAKNNIAVRGHTFVWHSQTPVWFFKENFNANGNWVSSSVMDQRMESYIKNMFAAIKQQYPSVNLYAYDVANECVSDNSDRTANNGGAREPGDNNAEGGKSGWVQVYGDNSFVEKAFTYARKYAPEGCDLYYNDYNEYWDHKRDCIYNMCKNLYQKGLLDGVGMQSHVPANATGFAGTDSYLEAMDKYLSIGCDVQVTELDISLEQGKYSLQDQATKYKAIFQHAMDVNTSGKYNGKVTLVAIWGPNDANSWLKEGSNALLYDKSNQPKLAYTTLTSMIPKSEWGDGSNYQGGDDKPIEPNEYGWYFADGFEGDTCSWSGRGSAEIMTSGRTAYVGEEALLVQKRESAWNGASKPLNAKAFVPGNEYSFSANVMYFDGDKTDKFYLKLQYTDAEGETQYSTIAEATAIQGEWVQLANKKYKIPDDASDMQIYVETAETTNNFYIDEVIGAVGGTSILGAGESKEIILGDVNFDGAINAIDVCFAKRGLIKGFEGNAAKIAADVDQSGVFDTTDIDLLQQFIIKKITEFPVAEPVIPPIDTAAMEKIFSGITYASSSKKEGDNNPLFTQRYGADPGVMEYNGRVYVYMTNDIYEYDSNGNIGENTFSKINQINCISSDDMVNWTDHGIINVAGSNGAAKWANNSWAPCAAHKKINGKEKFFLYFCNNASSIGVLTSDSPTGPWKDELGKAIVTKSTPNCADVAWLFDPAVMVDDDGTGYLAFGGGNPNNEWAHPKTARIAKLSDDMLSLSGTPVTIDAPYLFEDGGINKIGNKYYYTYCSNFNTDGNTYGLNGAAIQYMISDNPLGPYTYGGQMFKSPGDYIGGEYGANWGNNHHSIVTFNGQNYLFYHARTVKNALGITGDYRSPQVDPITVNGTQLSVKGTMTGVAQLKSLDPYQTVQAETMSNQSKGISVSGLGNTAVSGSRGDWIKVSGVDFANNTNSLTVKASSKNGAVIKVCQESIKGNAITYVEIPAGGSMSEITVPVVKSISGVNDIYFLFSGDLTFEQWYFS